MQYVEGLNWRNCQSQPRIRACSRSFMNNAGSHLGKERFHGIADIRGLEDC